MGLEEQKEEREILDSIYPDEITGKKVQSRFGVPRKLTLSSKDISETAYRIAIALDVTVQDDDEDDSEPPTINLHVSYPEAYPDEAPHLDLSSPPNAPRHQLIDVSEDKSRLLDSLNATIEESLGMAMIFTLVSTLKESAETLISDRQAQAQALKDVEAAKAEEEENRKFHGTAVTPETFLSWREHFRAEMAEQEKMEKEEKDAEDKKKRSVKAEEKKLTGKQLWERGLVGKVDEDEEDGVDAVAEIEKLKIGA